MNMSNWKSKQLDTRTKASRTNGRDKGKNCTATPLQKSFAKRNRSYKWRGYGQWLKTKNGEKG